jgi:hypothetical protein
MKFFWPILLICLVLGNSLKDKEALHEETKDYVFSNTLYELSENNKNRKLQDTDTTDGEVSADDPPKPISAADATAPMERNKGNSSAPYQIKKFYGFKQNKADTFFSFHMFFSFLRKIIASYIKMRLRILYSASRLRNLEDAAQSVPSTCNISAGFQAGIEGNGENIDYECNAPKDSGRMVSNINLDTTVPMDIGGETVPFDDVNFSDEAADQASNIAAANSSTDGWIVVNEFTDKFVIKGKPHPEPFLNSFVGKTINITFVTTSSRRRLEDKEQPYDCKVNSDTTDETEIQCDGVIETTRDNLKYARSDDIYLSLVPNSSSLPSEINANSGSGSGSVYRKSSSGLSGGAIAGIVIACVVVLIAAAVAAIMLRKPSPPIDNTTAVDLKQDNI